NNNNHNKNNNTTADTGYIGPYAVFYKYVASNAATSANAEISISSKSTRYSTDSSTASSNGFYRPIEALVETVAAIRADAQLADTTTLTIDGTAGDDSVVVATAAGKLVSITVNGKTTKVGSNIEAVYFNGGAGNDSVVYNATGKESASLDLKAAKVLVVGEQAFVAANVESFDANNVGAVDVAAYAASDYVTAAAGTVEVSTADGFVFNASGVAELVARGGGKAVAVMAGSSAVDFLTATGSVAILAGEGYSYQASGFATVRVDAGEGADVASLSGVQKLDASESAVIASVGSQTIVAVGFEQIDASGTGAGVANVFGTNKADYVSANSQTVSMLFSTGSTLNLNGFSDVSIDGRGGNDSASLVAGVGFNTFDGSLNGAKLTNGSFTRALANFSKVAVFGNEDENVKSTLVADLHDTAFADAFAAFGNTATMDVEGENLFTVVAADQVNVKRDFAKGADTLDEAAAIDFVFSVDNWDD
ncbi:MAG: hypothetical protein IK077_14725, partial [Thermoguttaceae bacterium]|nr:hypothetical protein [Thermoguttaceae bacterium]